MRFQGKTRRAALLLSIVILSDLCGATPMINQRVIENELAFEDYSGEVYYLKLDCRQDPCLLSLRASDGELVHKTEVSIPGERIDPQYLKIFSEINRFVPDYYYIEVGLEECPTLDACASGFLIEKGKQVITEADVTYVRISRDYCIQPNEKC